jgi:hypothetical protein
LRTRDSHEDCNVRNAISIEVEWHENGNINAVRLSVGRVVLLYLILLIELLRGPLPIEIARELLKWFKQKAQ